MAEGGSTKVGSAFVEVSPKPSGDFKSTIDKAMPSGTDGGSRYGGAFSQGMQAAMTAGAVAVGNILADLAEKGATAALDLTKQAVAGFSSYEQLAGGINKLYGIGSTTFDDFAASAGLAGAEAVSAYGEATAASRAVINNAEKAFETCGMSANQYMEQAMGFSAALVNSCSGDTMRAAELTDTAMRAMSDNVNTFGSDMSSVQNAFQGFAKQNYTMLDNLSNMGALAA